MTCHDLSRQHLHGRIRSVYGFCRGFRVFGQGFGRHERRRRTHRRCIGCEENTRQLPLHQFDRRRRPSTSPRAEASPFSGSAGIAFSRPGRAAFDGTARKDESMLAAASAATRRAWH